MNDDAKVAQFFNERAAEFGDSVESLDWGSRRTQQIRFAVLAEIGALNGLSILDVGCGLADFHGFLEARGIETRYTGIDLSSDLVAIAGKKHPQIDVRVANLLNEDVGEFDYVFGSGIHYLKVEDNAQRSEQLLRRMYEVCRIGVGTNMISAEKLAAGSLDDHVHAFEPGDVLAMGRRISNFVVLRQDYLPHDLSLFVYKQDFAARQETDYFA